MTEIKEAVDLIVEAGHALEDAKTLLGKSKMVVMDYTRGIIYDDMPRVHIYGEIEKIAAELGVKVETARHSIDWDIVFFFYEGVQFFSLKKFEVE